MKTEQLISSLNYGFADSPFGECCIAFSPEAVYALTFPDFRESALPDLQRRFVGTAFTLDNQATSQLAEQIFEKKSYPAISPLGTDFQKSVWEALCTISAGSTSTYSQIAELIGKPKAVRAVGTAVGANPIAFLIPCHRIIRTDGTLGGFRWGLNCKIKMLEWEKKYSL